MKLKRNTIFVLSIISLVACSKPLESSFSQTSDVLSSTVEGASSMPIEDDHLIDLPVRTDERVNIWDDDFKNYKGTVQGFSSLFTEKYFSSFSYSEMENVSISPASAYSALAMASAITNGDTRDEILSALGTDNETLSKEYKRMYQGVLSVVRFAETRGGKDGAVSYKTHVSNSIWLDESVKYKNEALDKLASDFFAYSIKEDFAKNNDEANKHITDFINKETDGLLDVDLNLKPDTLFVLLNCLYLKDLWHFDGSDIRLDKNTHEFINGDKTKTSTSLMYIPHKTTRMYKNEKFTSYFANANGGTHVYFLKPNDGVELKSILNAESFNNAMTYNYYNSIDEENKIIYHTSVAFPSFEAECNKDITPVFKEMGVKSLFKQPNKDFFPLADTDVYISEVKHVTKLKVDRKGIEGAAITAIEAPGASGPREGYTDIYEDFVADKAFAYVVATGSGIPLFSGVVNSINKL